MNVPAFPTVPKNHGYENALGTGSSSGMSLRDYFAAKAMQASIMAYPDAPDEKIASMAYSVADAMLIEKEKEQTNDSN